MSNFLRDRFIRSTSLDVDRIRTIGAVLDGIAVAVNANLPAGDPNMTMVKYMIRFDNKGFLLSDIDEVIDYYKSAKATERLNFILESEVSRNSRRANGHAVDLRFDALNISNCSLTVQADDNTWTDSVFCKLDEELEKFKNWNFFVRTGWTPFLSRYLV